MGRGGGAELNEFLRLRQSYETNFRNILQRTNLELIDEPGGKTLLFDLGRISRDYPLTNVAREVGAHFSSILEYIHPEYTYRLKPEQSVRGSTYTSYRIICVRPTLPDLTQDVFYLYGARTPIPGEIDDQGRIVISPDIVGRAEGEEILKDYYLALKTIKEVVLPTQDE